jgi:hypothetical protein
MELIPTNTYIGVLQSRQIQHIIKKQLTSEQTSRLQTILKTHLKSKNLTKAINLFIWKYIMVSERSRVSRKSFKNQNDKSQHVP